jgi:hypothetical protein
MVTGDSSCVTDTAAVLSAQLLNINYHIKVARTPTKQRLAHSCMLLQPPRLTGFQCQFRHSWSTYAHMAVENIWRTPEHV